MKLKTMMYEDEVAIVKKRKLMNSVNNTDERNKKNDDCEVNDVGEDEKEDDKKPIRLLMRIMRMKMTMTIVMRQRKCIP